MKRGERKCNLPCRVLPTFLLPYTHCCSLPPHCFLVTFLPRPRTQPPTEGGHEHERMMCQAHCWCC